MKNTERIEFTELTEWSALAWHLDHLHLTSFESKWELNERVCNIVVKFCKKSKEKLISSIELLGTKKNFIKKMHVVESLNDYYDCLLKENPKTYRAFFRKYRHIC